jgi:hypothetical protein
MSMFPIDIVLAQYETIMNLMEYANESNIIFL